MKRCPKCKKVRPEKEFHVRSDKPGKLQSWCKTCGLTFNRNKYAKNPEALKEAHHLYYLKNKKKTAKRGRKWRAKHPLASRKYSKKSKEKAKRLNPDKVENTRLKRCYGITLEFFNGLLLSQGGKCAICKNKAKLCVDHDHKTGRVRGLLCGHCNRAIGCLMDSPVSARNAAEYLE